MGNFSMTKAWTNSRDHVFNFLSSAENASLRAKKLTQQLLTFPKRRSSLKKPVPQASPLPLVKKGRILVMDDEESIRLVLSEMLNCLGYEAHCVAGGHEALECYQEAHHTHQPFKAVILDLTIKGGLGGKDTVQQLRKFDPHVKAIVASGSCNDMSRATYEKIGFHDVVAKPFQLAELRQALNHIIT